MEVPSAPAAKARRKPDYVAARVAGGATRAVPTRSRPKLTLSPVVARPRPAPRQRRTFLALALTCIGGLPLVLVAVPADTARAVVRPAPKAEPISAEPWALRTKLQHRLDEQFAE